MIDSAQKRMSVFELPGLMTNPFPAGNNTAPDRQQMADVYCGITALFPVPSNQTCWANSKSNTSPWVNSKRTTNVWSKENNNSSVWVDEKEVVPCQD